MNERHQGHASGDPALATSAERLRAGCPVCRATNVVAIDAPLDVPVMMNRTYASAADARQAARGVLSLHRCGACGFVWNAAFDPAIMLYDETYENDQTHSRAFVEHLAARAAEVVASVPADVPIDGLEVGCGQGRFIVELAAQGGARVRSIEGFDPAWRGADGAGPGGAHIHRCYFDATTSARLPHAPNVVVTRHTIEHVPDPVAFLTAIREALGPESLASVFVETPCVDWILQHEAMQDFCYEHCSLFTAGSLATALGRAGFATAHVHHVFGGQYLWAQASTRPSAEAPAAAAQQIDLAPVAGARSAYVAYWRRAVEAAAADGPVALWGAATKGVTFALLVDPQATLIDHVVDINPAKQGRHVAFTGLPILSPEAAAARRPRTIFVMNPNYLDEITVQADSLGIDARFLPIN